ncbi:MAG TPA: ferrous iron transport protein A [Deltaproteobacteria bacterium]|nr:ferrous iron transport protein A [Deltaproteobacteria bacterium]
MPPMIHNGISLSQVMPGKQVKIISLAGGRGLHARLISMGLIPGSIIEVVNQGMTGPCVVAQNGCRLAIGRGVAHKIIVSDVL